MKFYLEIRATRHSPPEETRATGSDEKVRQTWALQFIGRHILAGRWARYNSRTGS
jgi:hypothetical protein